MTTKVMWGLIIILVLAVVGLYTTNKSAPVEAPVVAEQPAAPVVETPATEEKKIK